MNNDQEPIQLGKHYIVELTECNPAKISKADVVEKTLVGAVEAAGATYISHEVFQFTPIGVSGIVLIAESHFSLHTWPERQYVALDIFTCGEQMRPDDAIFAFKKAFEAESVRVKVLSRGC